MSKDETDAIGKSINQKAIDAHNTRIAAEKQNQIDRLEPGIYNNNEAFCLCSIAISLKRIADIYDQLHPSVIQMMLREQEAAALTETPPWEDKRFMRAEKK